MGASQERNLLSVALTADGFSEPQSITHGGTLVATLNVSAVSGTVPTLNIWVQGSIDGVDWFDVPYDIAMPTAAAATDLAATEKKRNINGASSLSAVAKIAAHYRNFAFSLVRAAYVITGTLPSFTSALNIKTKSDSL